MTCMYIVSNWRRDPRLLKKGRRQILEPPNNSLALLEKEALPVLRLHSPQCRAFTSGAMSCPATNNIYSVIYSWVQLLLRMGVGSRSVRG